MHLNKVIEANKKLSAREIKNHAGALNLLHEFFDLEILYKEVLEDKKKGGKLSKEARALLILMIVINVFIMVFLVMKIIR